MYDVEPESIPLETPPHIRDALLEWASSEATLRMLTLIAQHGAASGQHSTSTFQPIRCSLRSTDGRLDARVRAIVGFITAVDIVRDDPAN